VEAATQTLHRVTWFERFDEATELAPPVDDPRIVCGFTRAGLSRRRPSWRSDRRSASHAAVLT
jgi:hypothetical protein